MPDPLAAQQVTEYITHLADDLKPWAPVGVPLILFGRKQAEALVKRFQDHFKHDAPETRAQARDNAADAAKRINDEVTERISGGELTREEARTAFERPDIAKHVQEALLVASETPDPFLHEELAKLIGARLAAPQDSRLNILLRMACDKLAYLNARQLRLLGLTFAILYIRPDFTSLEIAKATDFERSYSDYLEGLQNTVAPFRDIAPPQAVEYIHFEELGLAKLSAWSASIPMHEVSQSSLLEPLHRDFHAKALASADSKTPINPTVAWINGLMQGDTERDYFALQAVKLTPIGYLIADCAYCITHGRAFGLHDQWFEERV